jgi:hypothetical protein
MSSGNPWAGRQPTTNLIRISYFFSKFPSQSYEDFYEYWRNTHGRLAVATSAFTTHSVQRYVQVRNLPQHHETLRTLGMAPMEEFPWDACSEIYVRNFQDWVAFATSKESAEILGPDGAKIVDGSKGLRVAVGLVDEVEVRDRTESSKL